MQKTQHYTSSNAPILGQAVTLPTYESPQKFETTNSYRNAWAAILWVVSVLSVFVVGFVRLGDGTHGGGSLPGYQACAKIIGYITLAVSVATALSIPVHYLVRHHAEGLIYFGNVCYIFFLSGLCVYAFVSGTIVGGVILLIFTLVYAWWFASMRDRIPFAAICLRTSAEIINTYKATVLNAFFWLIVEVVFLVFWALGIYNTQRGDKEGFDLGAVTWLWLFFFYWTTQVISGIVHVTTCGVVAMWYFTGTELPMPPNPTLGALRRATTYSLGSICLGSLIVAALKVFRAMVNQATRNENEFVRCIVRSLVTCLENMMVYFNEYAYVHVAIYGKCYLEAARDTWRLVHGSGILAIINDQLLQLVYLMFIVGGSLITGVVLLAVQGAWTFFGLGVLLGLVVMSLLLGVVQSGVMTIFVCFAEEPMALQRSNCGFYDALNTAMAGLSPEEESHV